MSDVPFGKHASRDVRAAMTCEADGCERNTRGRVYCPGHRRRLEVTGSLDGPPIKTVPPKGVTGYAAAEFNGWDVTASGCWEYRGPKFANGYGQVKIDGIPTLLHRVSYEHNVGPIPEGLVIRHTCDNKPCMNPEHLETGTIQDNVQDRTDRNRTARGNQGRGLFTDDEALRIRLELSSYPERISRGQAMSRFALEFGASKSSVQKLWLRHTYMHVEGGYERAA